MKKYLEEECMWAPSDLLVLQAKERRKELQKFRVLQSYYEAKCRRIKRIKSKKYVSKKNGPE